MTYHPPCSATSFQLVAAILFVHTTDCLAFVERFPKRRLRSGATFFSHRTRIALPSFSSKLPHDHTYNLGACFACFSVRTSVANRLHVGHELFDIHSAERFEQRGHLR